MKFKNNSILIVIIIFIININIVLCINNYNNNDKIIIPNNNSIDYNNKNDQIGGIEVHSWNDLNEFDQIYKKGVTWKKIDVHYIKSYSFCKSQYQNDTRGCFVFSHDTPSNLIEYNNPNQLIEYLISRKDTWYNYAFTKKYIALCFKAQIIVCNNSSESIEYLQLSDEFINKLISTIQQYSLNVEFIIDGIIKPIGCLSNKFRPLISTWIHNPYKALTSNNIELGYDQFQVADIYIGPIFPSFWINTLCLLSPPFGKFQNSSFPILVWEPSNQAAIESVISSYKSCQLKHHTLSFPSLYFASNIDPVQLSLYSNTLLNNTWNLKLSINSNNQKLVSFNCNSLAWFLLFFSNNNNNDNNLYYQSYNSIQVLGNLNIGTYVTLVIPSNSLFKSHSLNSVKVLNNTIIILIDSQSNYLLFKILSNDNLSLFNFGKLNNVSPNEVFSISTFDTQLSNNNLIINQYYSSNICKLSTITFILNLNTFSIINPSSNCLVKDSIGIINSISIVGKLNNNDDSIEFILFYSNSNKDICSIYSIYKDGGNSLIAGPTKLNIGQQVSSSIFDNLIIQVHSDGYCYNSEIKNKRAIPKVCDSIPTSTKRILNYSFGTFNDWINKINNTLQPTLITSCDNSILHGTYNQGSYPNIHLYKQNSVIGLVEVHQGVPFTHIDLSGCGRPTSHNGLVLNSWKLFPQYLDINK